MAAALQHRGPDDQGKHVVQDKVGLAHTRLAINDIEGGHQPFTTPTGIVAIANGEIYNHLDLRKELNPALELKTHSDCEPIPYLYKQYGPDFVKHLRGMYAIALYDPHLDQLFLARDPFGIKPLYYAQTPQGLAFASEPQALIKGGLVKATLNTKGRDELLALNFTLGNHTLFAGIHRVLPGETLIVQKGKVINRHQNSYFSFDQEQITEASALEKFQTEMANSMKAHLLSDVPVGLFLSGGIDSTTLLLFMSQYASKGFKTYSIGFPGTLAHDERKRARELSKKLGTTHRELTFTEEDFWELLPKVAKSLDDPTADYACLPTYKLAQAVAQDGIKVVLSGEGGDELFAGYGRYRKALSPWRLGTKSLRRGNFDRLKILKRPLPSVKKAIKIQQELASSHAAPQTRLQQLQALDSTTWLPNDLMIKLDRCLMAHSLEGRPPFLDKRMAKFALPLPDKLKIKNRLGKWLVRQWLSTACPEAKPFSKKRGFTVPVGEWMAKKRDALAEELSTAPCLLEIATKESLYNFFKSLDPQNKHHTQAAWSLLFYRTWHKEHLE